MLQLFQYKSEMTAFKSSENIHEKEGGSYYVVSDNKASSVTNSISLDNFDSLSVSNSVPISRSLLRNTFDPRHF